MDDQVIASYLVKVTVRGPDGATAPTNAEVEEAFKNAITLITAADIPLTIRASSERTDK